jgi:hypothetical protein
MTEHHNEQLGRIEATLEAVASDVKTLRQHVPATCATHAKAIDTLEESQRDLWKALKGKASWVSVAVVLTVFGTILVIAIRT